MITKRIKIMVALLVLMVAALAFFKDTWIYGKIPVPADALVGLYHPFRDTYSDEYPRGVPFKNFLTTDPIRQQIPWRKLAIDQWRLGSVPRWNPGSFSGMPLAANIQAAVFYPLNILFFVLPFQAAWTMLIILQPLLAAVFMFVYLRGRSFRLASATFGSIVWALNGFHSAWLTWGTINHVTLWLPLALFCADALRRAADNPTPKGSFVKQLASHINILTGPALALGVISALQIFAGHIQMAVYSMVLVFGYIIGFPADRSKHKINRVRLSIGFLAVIAFTGVISAVQVIPLLSVLRETSRVDQLLNWQNAGWFLPWQHLVQFIAPDFFGNPATLNYWGVWNYGEFIGYIGMLPFIYALSALLLYRKNQFVRFWVVVVGCALAFMLPWFGSRLLYILQVPVLSVLQPTRLMVLVVLGLTLLSVYGFDEWLKFRKTPKLALTVVIVVVCALWIYVYLSLRQVTGELIPNLLVSRRNLIIPACLAAVGILVFLLAHFSVRLQKPKLFSLLILAVFGIVTGDLYRVGWKFVPFTDVRYFYPESKVISFLQMQPKPFRIMSTDDRILAPNIPSYYHLESIEGYDPLYFGRYERFVAAMEKQAAEITPPFGYNRIITPKNITSPLLPLLNVRYVLSLTPLPEDNFREVFREGTTRVYEVLRTLPRAYFATIVHRVNPGEDVLPRLFTPEFTDTTAWVEGNPEEVREMPEPNDSATVLPYDGQTLRVRTKTAHGRYLIISEMHNPIWSATIDGKPVQIYRTNYIFMGVVVPPGDHEIHIRPVNGL